MATLAAARNLADGLASGLVAAGGASDLVIVDSFSLVSMLRQLPPEATKKGKK